MPTRSPGANRVTAAPDRLDDAGALVAEHRRQRHRVPLVAADQVGVADPGRRDRTQHLVGAQLAELQLLQRERRAFALHD